jgi:hypothetical protein
MAAAVIAAAARPPRSTCTLARGSAVETGVQVKPRMGDLKHARSSQVSERFTWYRPEFSPYWVCTGPVEYSGAGGSRAREIALLKQAAASNDVFLTSAAPASLEVYRKNEYYASDGFPPCGTVSAWR